MGRGCPPGLGMGQMHTNTSATHVGVVSVTPAPGLRVCGTHVCVAVVQAGPAGWRSASSGPSLPPPPGPAGGSEA